MYIIAEVGSNYCNDYDLALKHIEAASRSGANAVKFQLLNVDQQYYAPSQQIRELHSKADCRNLDDLVSFKKACDFHNIDFMCSGTYLEAVSFIEKLNPSYHKIASAQVPNFPQYCELIARTGRPTLASTGISQESEINRLVDIFKSANAGDLTLLHCRSIYPLSPLNSALSTISILRKKFNLPVGLSDHTLDSLSALISIGLGVTIIEKHFKLDDTINSPDSDSSLNAKDFKKFVDECITASHAYSVDLMGGYRTLSSSEMSLRKEWVVRVFAKEPIKKGCLLKENVYFKRYSKGLTATEYYELTSNNHDIISTVDIDKDQVIVGNNLTLT